VPVVAPLTPLPMVAPLVLPLAPVPVPLEGVPLDTTPEDLPLPGWTPLTTPDAAPLPLPDPLAAWFEEHDSANKTAAHEQTRADDIGNRPPRVRRKSSRAPIPGSSY
jgi:hypothetical protein